MPIVPRPFTWADGDRTIRFGAGAGAHAWPGAALLSTPRARASIPPALRDGWSGVHDVPAGQVVDAAAALVGAVGDGPIVAWGGGRVIDTAKALAAARGGRVCAVPTTLSGAEMTGGHRQVPGYEARGRHRPVLVLADPALMTGQPAAERRRSAMNALAHAAEALYGPGANPVASMAAAAASTLIAEGLGDGRRRVRAACPGGAPGRLRHGLRRLLAAPRALPDDRAAVWDAARGDERGHAAARARGDARA